MKVTATRDVFTFSTTTDNEGQIVIYTGYYETEDGDISEEPQDVELE